MSVGRVVAVIFWSLGGILIMFAGISVAGVFLGFDPIYDLWKTDLGLVSAEMVDAGVLLILSGSWVVRKNPTKVDNSGKEVNPTTR